MEASDHLTAIASDGAALADTAASELEHPVPSCPGWDMGKLALHVGLVHMWAGESIRRRAPEGVDRATLPRAPDGPGRIPWLRDSTACLVDALEAADDDDPAGNWRGGPANAAFWRRRMAHETAVHRWDAQAALARPEPINAQLAADGIAEVVEVLLPLLIHQPANASAIGTLHLHCTDTTGEWLLSVENGRLAVSTGHAKADAALRGGASELFLTCWGRRSGAAPEVLGDQAVADRWLATMGW
ncbi:MAG TPA: maleylpyruvate isomerase family mycothiol-dependent enzyme [Acidimicrobiales bacterium]